MTAKDTNKVGDLTYEDKLSVLKKMHSNWHPEAKEQLEKWGDELSRLKLEDDWLKHPSANDLRFTLSEQLQRIDSVLSNDQSLTEIDRKVHFKSKEFILQLLAVVTRDPESEMKSIQEQIDENL